MREKKASLTEPQSALNQLEMDRVLEEQNGEIRRLKEQNKQLEQDLRYMRTSSTGADALQVKVVQTTQQLMQAQQHIKELTSELQRERAVAQQTKELYSSHDALITQNKELKAALEFSNEKCTRIERENVRLNERVASSEASAARLVKESQEKEKAIIDLSKRVQHSDQQMVDLRAHALQLEDANQQLQLNLKQVETRVQLAESYTMKQKEIQRRNELVQQESAAEVCEINQSQADQQLRLIQQLEEQILANKQLLQERMDAEATIIGLREQCQCKEGVVKCLEHHLDALNERLNGYQKSISEQLRAEFAKEAARLHAIIEQAELKVDETQVELVVCKANLEKSQELRRAAADAFTRGTQMVSITRRLCGMAGSFEPSQQENVSALERILRTPSEAPGNEPSGDSTFAEQISEHFSFLESMYANIYLPLLEHLLKYETGTIAPGQLAQEQKATQTENAVTVKMRPLEMGIEIKRLLEKVDLCYQLRSGAACASSLCSDGEPSEEELASIFPLVGADELERSNNWQLFRLQVAQLQEELRVARFSGNQRRLDQLEKTISKLQADNDALRKRGSTRIQ